MGVGVTGRKDEKGGSFVIPEFKGKISVREAGYIR
jgi:hypothetical protein